MRGRKEGKPCLTEMITPIMKAQYWKSRKMMNPTGIFDGVWKDIFFR